MRSPRVAGPRPEQAPQAEDRPTDAGSCRPEAYSEYAEDRQRPRRSGRTRGQRPSASRPGWRMAGCDGYRAGSYPLDDLLAEEPLRPEQQEREGQHIGEPVLDGAAYQRAPIHLGHFLPDPDDGAADDGAGDRGEPAEDEHGQRLERDEREAELDPALGSPHR